MPLHLNKLTGPASFPAWRQDLVAAFEYSDISKFLSTDCAPPARPVREVEEAVEDYSFRHQDWRGDIAKYDREQQQARELLYNSVTPEVRRLAGCAGTSRSPGVLYKSICDYYERSSYTQQCGFVTGLTSKLSDYETVDEYHSAFKQAAEGLANVFDQQQPDLLARYDSDAGESAQSLLTMSDWLRRRTTLLKHINTSRAQVERLMHTTWDDHNGKEATSVSLPPAEGVTGGTAQTPVRPRPTPIAAPTDKYESMPVKEYSKLLGKTLKQVLEIFSQAEALSSRTLIASALAEAKTAHQRAVTVPLYLRGIQEKYADIVTGVKTSARDPRTVELANVMAEVNEREELARLDNAQALRMQSAQKKQRKEKKGDPCSACGFKAGHPESKCWVRHPHLATESRREHFQKRHDEWKAKQTEELATDSAGSNDKDGDVHISACLASSTQPTRVMTLTILPLAAAATAYTPQQNGMAEKANHVIVTRARVMMIAANLPACL